MSKYWIKTKKMLALVLGCLFICVQPLSAAAISDGQPVQEQEAAEVVDNSVTGEAETAEGVDQTSEPLEADETNETGETAVAEEEVQQVSPAAEGIQRSGTTLVLHYNRDSGNDDNDGSLATPKKTLQATLDSIPQGAGNVEIKALAVGSSNESASVPNDRGIESLMIESVNSLQTLGQFFANGVKTTIKDFSVGGAYGGSYERDVHGDTYIAVIGEDHVVTVTHVLGGGYVRDNTQTADVYGNTTVIVKNFVNVSSSYEVNVGGGGRNADIFGNTSVHVSGGQAASSATAPNIVGGGYVPYSGQTGTYHANVSGNTYVEASDGAYGMIAGNTNHNVLSPRYDVTSENKIGGSTTVKVRRITAGEVIGNVKQVLSGMTGATTVRPYGSYRVDGGITIDIEDSQLTSSTHINTNSSAAKMGLLNTRGLYASSMIENGDTYVSGGIDVSISGASTTIQGIYLGDRILQGVAPAPYEEFRGGQAEIVGDIHLRASGGVKIGFLQSLSSAYNTNVLNVSSDAHNNATREVWARIRGNVTVDASDSLIQWTTGSHNAGGLVSKENLTLDGNLTYNYRDFIGAVKEVVTGYEYAGVQNGDISLNMENCYGDTNGRYINQIIGNGDTNAFLMPERAEIDINGDISFDLKNVTARFVCPGSKVAQTVSTGSVDVNLTDSVIGKVILGHNNYVEGDYTSTMNGDVNFSAANTSVEGLIAGPRTEELGGGSILNGDIGIKMRGGTIGSLYASGSSEYVGNTTEVNGDIDIHLTAGTAFTIDSNLYSAYNRGTLTNGYKKIVLDDGAVVKNFKNDVQPFDEIHIGDTVVVTNRSYGSAETASKLNILGSWEGDSTLVAAKYCQETPELAWYTQDWGPDPVMRYEDDGNYDGAVYEGRWFINTPMIRYSVTYEGNEHTGGSVPTDPAYYASGTDVTVLSEGDLVKSGYEFAGWNTEADGSGEFYEPGDTFPITEDMVLYAVWEPVSEPALTVTYDGNGHTSGSVVTDPQNYTSGDTVTVLGQGDLVREGHFFTGWNTEADGSGQAYMPGDTFVITEDVQLYAKWREGEPQTVSVVYDGNGHTGGSAPVDDEVYVTGDLVTVLGRNDLVKEGYTFTGWNTEADGSGQTYMPGDTFTITEDVLLYARWREGEPQTVSVVYDGNGHTGGSAPEDDEAYVTGDLVTVLGQNDLVREGYSFTGWNTAADGSGSTYSEDDTFTITGNTTLYAQWEEANEDEDQDDNATGKSGKSSNRTSGGKTGKGVSTGDNSPVLIYGGLALLALIAAVIIIKKRKRLS